MRAQFNSWELWNGIRDANKKLRTMCGGEQLVKIYDEFKWIYKPRSSELRYKVLGDAPQEAIDRARELCERWSYADLVVSVGSGGSQDNATFSLWHPFPEP